MNYPEISRGLGSLTPALWSRLMDMLRDYEGTKGYGDINSRLRNLEIQQSWFFAKLLRASVFDTGLDNPNVYKYAWVKVEPKTGDPECCANCLETRPPVIDCCNAECNTSDDTLQLQGLFQWDEVTSVSSWGTNTYAPTADGPVTVPYVYPAVNTMELFNTGNLTAPGTDETNGLGSFQMQAIGGFDTLDESVDPAETRTEGELNVTPVVMMRMYPESDGTLRYLFQAENSYDGDCSICTE